MPSIAGPKRPQDRILLSEAKSQFEQDILSYASPSTSDDIVDLESKHSFPASDPGIVPGEEETHTRPVHISSGVAGASRPVEVKPADGSPYVIDNGAVTLAAITSCTNTSNPSVMIAAGLVARNALDKGLKSNPWVKNTLGPGSKVVTDY